VKIVENTARQIEVPFSWFHGPDGKPVFISMGGNPLTESQKKMLLAKEILRNGQKEDPNQSG